MTLGQKMLLGGGTFLAGASLTGIPTSQLLIAHRGDPPDSRWDEDDGAADHALAGAALGFVAGGLIAGSVALRGASAVNRGPILVIGGTSGALGLVSGAIAGGIHGTKTANGNRRSRVTEADIAHLQERLAANPGVSMGLAHDGARALSPGTAVLGTMAVVLGGAAGVQARRLASTSTARSALAVAGATGGAAAVGLGIWRLRNGNLGAGANRPAGTVAAPAASTLEPLVASMPTGTAATATVVAQRKAGFDETTGDPVFEDVTQEVSWQFGQQVGQYWGYDSIEEAEHAAELLIDSGGPVGELIAVVESAPGRYALVDIIVRRADGAADRVDIDEYGINVVGKAAGSWESVSALQLEQGTGVVSLVNHSVALRMNAGEEVLPLDGDGASSSDFDRRVVNTDTFAVDQWMWWAERNIASSIPAEYHTPIGFPDAETAVAVMRLAPGDQTVVRAEPHHAWETSEVRYFIEDSDPPQHRRATDEPSLPADDGRLVMELHGQEFVNHDGWWMTPGEITPESFSG